MAVKKTSLKPRKKPLQRRSIHTVDAIFEATVQVLLAQGQEKLTTTKVAERAGVSVGTLYQYFGDKRGLLHGAMERHLQSVIVSVEQACLEQRGKPLASAVNALVGAFVDAKFADAAASRALYLVAPDVEGRQMVALLMQRGQLAIADLLANAQDIRVDDPITVSLVLSTSLMGPVQALLELDAPGPYRAIVQQHLAQMMLGYLKQLPSQSDGARNLHQ